MRVRIIQLPEPADCDLQGFEVSHFEMGKIYDVGLRLGELLIVCGYAEPETRRQDRAADRPKKRR